MNILRRCRLAEPNKGTADAENAPTARRAWLMQDFTAFLPWSTVAAMRERMVHLRGEPQEDHPLVPGRSGHRPLGHRCEWGFGTPQALLHVAHEYGAQWRTLRFLK